MKVSLGEGKTQQNISKVKIENFPIIVPRPEIQEQVVEIMTTVDEQIEALENETDQASSARAALLDELLRREIEIRDCDEIDPLA